jgi:nucleotide-binding universal stress UspA family protein
MSRRPEAEQLAALAREERSCTPKILIGFDGTETAWNAFSWACGEAKRTGGTLVAAFVSPERPAQMVATVSAISGIPCDYQALESAVVEQARAMEAQLKRQAAQQGVDLAFLHAYGDPASELSRIAQAVQADLIAVGKSTSVVHHLAGSVGRRLMGGRETPVVVVVP